MSDHTQFVNPPCERCGIDFERTHPMKRFCSERCRSRAEKSRRGRRKTAANPKRRLPSSREPRPACVDCGTAEGMDWWVGRGYLSAGSGSSPATSAVSRCRQCYNEMGRTAYWRRKGMEAPPKRSAGAKAPEPTVPRAGVCAECGSSFVRKNPALYCSKSCKSRAYMRRKGWTPSPPREPKPKVSPLRFGECVCGAPFIARGSRRYCSDECRDRAYRGRISEKLMGLYWASVEAREIRPAMHWHRALCAYLADRDGGRCGICNKPVDVSLPSGTRHGKRGEYGPSIDHVVPKSRGGGDELPNLRLTHWGCNRRRGNRGDYEQLRLVG